MFLWVCAGVSSKLPGALGAALSRNDPDRLSGSRPIPLGRQNPAATGTPAARSPSGRKRIRPWLGGSHRTVGSSTGPLAGSTLSLPGPAATGQAPAPGRTAPVPLSALSWVACHQQLRRAGDPPDGDGSQDLGRQSHSQWRPHAANSSQCSPHLLATEQRRLCRVGEVTALRSSHPAGNRSDRTVTLSWLAKSSALPRSFRPLRSPTTSNRSSATLRAYPTCAQSRGKHSPRTRGGCKLGFHNE